MDGTIADFYANHNWLECLQAHDATPYFKATELYDMDYLNALIELYKDAGGRARKPQSLFRFMVAQIRRTC